MPVWQPIETAPRDGTTIFGSNWKTGQRGMVSFNSQNEWELINGLTNLPMGIGFYPTHWFGLLKQPCVLLKSAERTTKTRLTEP